MSMFHGKPACFLFCLDWKQGKPQGISTMTIFVGGAVELEELNIIHIFSYFTDFPCLPRHFSYWFYGGCSDMAGGGFRD